MLRAPEVFFRARAALGGNVRIAAVPLVGAGILDALEQLVVHDVAAESVRLQIPGKAVEGGVDVATGAADLPLKRLARGIEGLLAVAQNGDTLRPGQRDRRSHAVGARVDHADRVFQPIGHKQLAAIAAQRQLRADCAPPECAPPHSWRWRRDPARRNPIAGADACGGSAAAAAHR